MTAFIEIKIPLTTKNEYDAVTTRVMDLLMEQFEHRDIDISARLGDERCSICGAVLLATNEAVA